MQALVRLTALAVLTLLIATSGIHAMVPQVVSFQGLLNDGTGTPVADGSYPVTFKLYTTSAGGAALWTESQSVTTVGGQFNVLLGTILPIPDSAFADTACYLGVAVSPDPELVPRSKIASVGYSYRVYSVDQAQGGNIQGKLSIGPGHVNTGDYSFVAGYSNSATGIFSVISGGRWNHAGGFYSTVGGGESDTATGEMSTVGGGWLNVASGIQATVSGGAYGRATGDASVVSGGGVNTASGLASTVAGGSSNLAAGEYCVVGGGAFDTADGSQTTIGGGFMNYAAGAASTIGGGSGCRVLSHYGVIAGGTGNTVSDEYGAVGGGGGNHAMSEGTAIAGGWKNLAEGEYAFIGGGDSNYTSATFAVVAGGFRNAATNFSACVLGGELDTASGQQSFVGGGVNNVSSGYQSVVVGGYLNRATTPWAGVVSGQSNIASGTNGFVGGGSQNLASSSNSVVAGGSNNTAGGDYATVGGGGGSGAADSNQAMGVGSTVPGGRGNRAVGHFSFAAGLRARAEHDGTFVWADDANVNFASTATDQFLVRAAGGVGLGTNAPKSMLDVEGGAVVGATYSGTSAAPTNGLLIEGMVGINTTTTAAQLDVKRSGTVALFDRTGTDGTVINIGQDGTAEGSISVSGTTVSYNAFTGSHYGWTTESLEPGTLVSLTGDNRNLHDRENAEVIYGIKQSTEANDPACLGAYLSVLEPGEPLGQENPHLVTAVGNGMMWIVESDGGVSPGDYLIASDVAGHAMKDSPDRFAIGHIVARAAERVDWSAVTDTVGGRKHKKVSVLFGNFVRSNTTLLENAIRGLEDRLRQLEGGSMRAERP